MVISVVQKWINSSAKLLCSPPTPTPLHAEISRTAIILVQREKGLTGHKEEGKINFKKWI